MPFASRRHRSDPHRTLRADDSARPSAATNELAKDVVACDFAHRDSHEVCDRMFARVNADHFADAGGNQTDQIFASNYTELGNYRKMLGGSPSRMPLSAHENLHPAFARCPHRLAPRRAADLRSHRRRGGGKSLAHSDYRKHCGGSVPQRARPAWRVAHEYGGDHPSKSAKLVAIYLIMHVNHYYLIL